MTDTSRIPRELTLAAIKSTFRSAHRLYWEGRPRKQVVIMNLLAEAVRQTLWLVTGTEDARSTVGDARVLERQSWAESEAVRRLPALFDASRAVARGTDIPWVEISRFLSVVDGALTAIFAVELSVSFDEVGAPWLVRDPTLRRALEEAERAQRRGFTKEALVTAAGCLESLRDRWSELAAFPVSRSSRFYRGNRDPLLVRLVFGEEDRAEVLAETWEEELSPALTDWEEVCFEKMGFQADDIVRLQRILPYSRRLATCDEGDLDALACLEHGSPPRTRHRDADVEFLIERTAHVAFELERLHPVLIREAQGTT